MLNSQWIRFIEINANVKKLAVEFDRGNCIEYDQIAELNAPDLKKFKMQGIESIQGEINEFFNKICHWQNIERIDFGNIPKHQVDLL